MKREIEVFLVNSKEGHWKKCKRYYVDIKRGGGTFGQTKLKLVSIKTLNSPSSFVMINSLPNSKI